MKMRNHKRLIRFVALILVAILCLDASVLYGLGFLTSKINAFAEDAVNGLIEDVTTIIDENSTNTQINGNITGDLDNINLDLIVPVMPAELPQFLGATVTPDAAKVAEIVAKIQNRASTMSKEQLAGLTGSYYVFAITTPEELVAVQEASKTDTLADCAFTLAKSGDYPDNVLSKNADIASIAGFTGISPDANYPFEGVFSAYIDNVNYTITCPLFKNLSTDAVVHNISLYSLQSTTATAAIAENLVKGVKESIYLNNIHIKGAFGVNNYVSTIGIMFANIINTQQDKLVFNLNDYGTIYFEADTISGSNAMPVVSGNGILGGIIGRIDGNVEFVIGNSQYPNQISISAGNGATTGKYIGYVQNGAIIRIVSTDFVLNVGGINGKYVGGMIGKIEGTEAKICQVTVEDEASLIINATGDIGKLNVTLIAGGLIGDASFTDINLQNITCYKVSIKTDKEEKDRGIAGGLVGRITNSTSGSFKKIVLQAKGKGDCALVAFLNGGVVGELIADNYVFDDIDLKGEIWYGDAEHEYSGGLAARVSGYNITCNDIYVEARAINLGLFRGKIRGCLFGEIFNQNETDYNSIKVSNVTATGIAGAADGGLGRNNQDVIVTQGIIAGELADNTILCLDGVIDLTKTPQFDNPVDNVKSGLLVGVRNNALVYAEQTANIQRAPLANRTGTLDDIGTDGGVFINREINANGDLLINFNVAKENIKNCVAGVVSKTQSGANILADESDFMRMSIYTYTDGNFAANCFEETDIETLLSTDIEITADVIDLRGTGIYSLIRNNVTADGATDLYAFSGSFIGKEGKTEIILENVLTTQYNLGLFSCVNNARFVNLSIQTGENPEDTGYTYPRNFGSLAAVAFNNLTLENVDINTKVNIFKDTYTGSLYYGGAVGLYKMNSGKFAVSDCNLTPTLNDIRMCSYAAGLVGFLTADEVKKNSSSPYDITIKNVTIGTKLYTKDQYFENNEDERGRFAGLISHINYTSRLSYNWEGNTYTKIAMQNIVVDGFVMDMTNESGKTGNNYTYTGGMLGTEWVYVDVDIKQDAVDNTNTSGISLLVRNADFDIKLRVGGLISAVGGRVLFKDVVMGDLDGESLIDINNMKNLTHLGMLVQDARAAYILVDNYTINSEKFNIVSKVPIDDIVGMNLNEVQGNRGGIVNIKDDGFKDGTSPGYISKLSSTNNGQVRYYYNLFEFDEKYAQNALAATINNEYKMMIFSLAVYSNQFVKAFFYDTYVQNKTKNEYTLTGTIDLSKHSYYPIQLETLQKRLIGTDAVIVFPTEERINKTHTVNSLESTEARHYRLWSGLLIGHIEECTISGITFRGVVSHSTKGAFLFTDYVSGNVTISDITLDGAYIRKYNMSKHKVGLLITAINDGSDFDISNIRMINYNTGSSSGSWLSGKVASALIGSVGNSEAKNVKVEFNNIKIDYLNSAEDAGKETGISNNISPFAHASLICSYDYTINAEENQSFGVYYFTSEEYDNGNITIGKELKDNVEFKDDLTAQNEALYEELYNISVLVDGAPDKYLPYVCTNDSEPTIFVNPKTGNILEGCGTYQDPYIISSPRQIYSLFMYLADNQAYDKLLNGWQVNAVGNQKSTSACTHKTNGTNHTYYVYDGYNTANNTNFPTRDKLASAYYIISEDINMADFEDLNMINASYDFVGLGCENYPFTGVIVGKKENGDIPVITLPGITGTRYKENSAFIQTMSGGVVKDLIIRTAYGTGDGQTTEAEKLIITGTSAMVVSTIVGGDNIIDNVTIEGTLFISNTNNDYVGGYVGIVKKGGLIVRNITSEHLTAFNVESGVTDVALKDGNYAYIVPKVHDGYVVYEDTTGAFKADEPVIKKEHFVEVTPLYTLDRFELVETYELVNTSYLDDDEKIKVARRTGDYKGYGIKIELRRDKHLQILSMAMNTDALSVSATGIGPIEISNAYNRNVSTRKALYDSLGNVGDDCTSAVTYDNGGFIYPYLLMKYFKFDTAIEDYYTTKSITEVIDGQSVTTEYVVSQLNKTASIEGIVDYVDEYYPRYALSSSSITTLCDTSIFGYAFRGIGAQYYKKYSKFNCSFEGEGVSIYIDMDNKFDVQLNNLALFNEIDTSIFAETLAVGGTPDDIYRNYIEEIELYGSVKNYNETTASGYSSATDGSRTGGLISALKGHMLLEKITINGMEITGYGDVGGVIGRVLNHGDDAYYSLELKYCDVLKNGDEKTIIESYGISSDWKYTFEAGGLIGKIGASGFYINDEDLADSASVYSGFIEIKYCKVDGASITAKLGSAGGYVGTIRCLDNTTVEIKADKSDAVKYAYVTNTTLSISSESEHNNGSAGGLIGEYFAVRRLQSGGIDNVAHKYNNKLKIRYIEVSNLVISASNMTDRDIYNKKDLRGHYGLGGMIGIAFGEYADAINDVDIKGSDVSNITISDTSTLSFQNGSSGGIAGAIGYSSRKNDNTLEQKGIIDAFTINTCNVSDVIIYAGAEKNWAKGGVAGQLVADDLDIRTLNADGLCIAGVNGATGGLFGAMVTNNIHTYRYNNVTNSLIRDVVVDDCELYNGYSAGEISTVNSISGVTGGLVGILWNQDYTLGMYNIDVTDSKLAGQLTGGIVGTVPGDSIIKFECYELDIERNKMVGKMVGGIFGGLDTDKKYSYYDSINVKNNQIFAYSSEDNYEHDVNLSASAGGLIGRAENLEGYYTNIFVEDNVIATNCKRANKAGGFFGKILGGDSRLCDVQLKNNIIGFSNSISGFDKQVFTKIDGTDEFDKADFVNSVVLLNTSVEIYVYEKAPEIAKQTDLVVYSYGIGNMIGYADYSAKTTILAPKVIYDEDFEGTRPVTDVGIMHRYRIAEPLSLPSATELSAVLKFTEPTRQKGIVRIAYALDADGNDIKMYETGVDGTDNGTYYPTLLSEFADTTTAFGSLGSIMEKYQEILDKEAAGTLTTKEILDNYRLNIAYSGTINPNYMTINQLVQEGVSHINLSDAVTNMDGVDIPIIVADGQYTNAQNLVTAVIDAMTNVVGDGTSTMYIDSRKAKLVKDGNGDCTIEYLDGTPTIAINESVFSYNGYDTFGEEGGNEYATISVVRFIVGWSGGEENYYYSVTVDDAADTKIAFKCNTIRTYYVPIFVKERLEVNQSYVICEGAVYDTESIENKGYSGDVVIAKDTTYSILSEFTYGKSIVKDNYGSLYTEKKIKLTNEDGTPRSMDAGTLLTLIEVNTGKVYYYEVQGTEIGGISYTSFKDAEGNYYENHDMNWFRDNDLVKTDNEGEPYGEEKFITIVDLPENSKNAEYSLSISTEDTDVRLMDIIPAEPINIEAIPGLNINFENKVYVDDGSAGDKTYVAGELTNSQRDSITIDMLTAIKAAIDDTTGFAGYWNYANGNNIIDSSNNGKYLEIAIYLQEQGSAKRVSLPVGTKAVVYDDANPEGRGIEIAYGQSVIYYYKNSDREYELDAITQDTIKTHKVVLDFSSTDLRAYKDANYEIYMELLRTTDPDYPMSSDRRDDYRKTVSTAMTKEFAIAMEVKDLITLGINIYRQREYLYDIPFISKIDFGDIIDFENLSDDNIDILCEQYSNKNYLVTYRLYKKQKDGGGFTYVPIDNSDIKLFKETKDGSGNIISQEYDYKEINDKFVYYVDTYNFTADEIEQGSTIEGREAINGLILRELNLVVNTENMTKEDLSNYKIEMRLVPYDLGLNEDNISDENEAISDYFIFTIANLKTDM